MSEQNQAPAPKRQVQPGDHDSSTGKWTIDGFGEKPKLRIRLYLNATLDSEKEDYLKYVADCKAKDIKPEPQTKYPHIVDAVFKSYSDMFDYARISAGWTAGKMAREGDLPINADFDDTPGKKGAQKFTLHEGAEIPSISFPPERRARTQKSLQEQMAELPAEEQMKLMREQTKALNLTREQLLAMLDNSED